MQTKVARFKTEAELQNHCAEVLRRKGRFVRREVECGVEPRLKADIVTGTTIYEVKLILDRGNMYQAKGQGVTYAGLLRKNRVVLVGYLPEEEDKRVQALNLARNIELAGHAKVSFVDIDPFWDLAPISYRPLWYVALLVGAIALAVFAIPLFREEVGCRVYPDLEDCTVDRGYRP